MKLLIEKLIISCSMKYDFQEVSERNNKVMCNFSLPGQEFPGKHTKKAQSHNPFMSIWLYWWRGWRTKVILIQMVSCVGCTVNGFNSHMSYGEKQGGVLEVGNVCCNFNQCIHGRPHWKYKLNMKEGNWLLLYGELSSQNSKAIYLLLWCCQITIKPHRCFI